MIMLRLFGLFCMVICIGCSSSNSSVIGNDDLYALAVQRLEEGEEKEAVKLFRRLLTEYPDQTADTLKMLRHLRNARRVHQLRHPDEFDKHKLNAKGKLMQRLREIVLPKVSFKNVPLSEALVSLKAMSTAADPEGIGVKFLNLGDRGVWRYVGPKHSAEEFDDDCWGDDDDDDNEKDQYAKLLALSHSEPLVNLELTDVRIIDVLESMCVSNGLHWHVGGNFINIEIRHGNTDDFMMCFFYVDPKIFGKLTEGELKEYFTDRGVRFPTNRYGDGASLILV